MKDLNEYKSEIYRRSAERMALRRRHLRQWIGIGSAFCLCLIFSAILTLPKFMAKSNGDGMISENSGIGEPGSSNGAGASFNKNDSLADADDAMAPESGSSENKTGAPSLHLQKSKGYANISLALPKSWKYEWEEGEEEGFSLRIAPRAAKEGWIRIEYNSAFGVCGTGLSVEKITLGRYTAEQGIYDEGPVWDYIHLQNTPGHYTLYSENIASWWNGYEKEAMEILNSLQVGVGVVAEYKAVVLAQKECDRDYPHHWAEFDSRSGQWKIRFFESYEQNEKEQVVVLDHHGKVLEVRG